MNDNYNENEQNSVPQEEDNEYVYKSVMDGRTKSRAWSVASLCVAIASVLCCCSPWCAVGFGALGIIFAIISRNRIGYFDGPAIAGLIVAIFGVVFGISGFVFTYLVENTDMFEELIKEMEQYEQEMLPGSEV